MNKNEDQTQAGPEDQEGQDGDKTESYIMIKFDAPAHSEPVIEPRNVTPCQVAIAGHLLTQMADRRFHIMWNQQDAARMAEAQQMAQIRADLTGKSKNPFKKH